MLFHPRVGANTYDRHVYYRETARPGWNAIHPAKGSTKPVRYMWISDKDGKLTETKPDVQESEIFHIHEDDLPLLEQSHAWRRAQEMAAIVGKRGLGGISEERVTKVMDHIRAASNCSLGVDSSVDERIERGISAMREVAKAKEKSLSDFTEPSRAVVRECLNFGLTITHASNVLAILLLQYARTPSPVDKTPLADRIRANADHLIDRTVALSRERMRMNLTSFYEATYLGLLYGNAALLMLRETAKHLPKELVESLSLERRGLYIDEHMAHELGPCLMHPIDFAPSSTEEYFRAQGLGIEDPGGMYAGAGDQGSGSVDPQTRWPMIQEFSAQAEEVDIIATVDGENSPLREEERERLMLFLLTLGIGEQSDAGADKT